MRNLNAGGSRMWPNKKKVEEVVKKYTTEETRVHNKRIAPSGRIFLVVKASGKGAKYSNCMPVPFGLTEEQKDQVYKVMYGQLVAKYGI